MKGGWKWKRKVKRNDNKEKFKEEKYKMETPGWKLLHHIIKGTFIRHISWKWQKKKKKKKKKKGNLNFLLQTVDFLFITFDSPQKTCIICHAKYWKGFSFRGCCPLDSPHKSLYRAPETIFRKNTALLSLGDLEILNFVNNIYPCSN